MGTHRPAAKKRAAMVAMAAHRAAAREPSAAWAAQATDTLALATWPTSVRLPRTRPQAAWRGAAATAATAAPRAAARAPRAARAAQATDTPARAMRVTSELPPRTRPPAAQSGRAATAAAAALRAAARGRRAATAARAMATPARAAWHTQELSAQTRPRSARSGRAATVALGAPPHVARELRAAKVVLGTATPALAWHRTSDLAPRTGLPAAPPVRSVWTCPRARIATDLATLAVPWVPVRPGTTRFCLTWGARPAHLVQICLRAGDATLPAVAVVSPGHARLAITRSRATLGVWVRANLCPAPPSRIATDSAQ